MVAVQLLQLGVLVPFRKPKEQALHLDTAARRHQV